MPPKKPKNAAYIAIARNLSLIGQAIRHIITTTNVPTNVPLKAPAKNPNVLPNPLPPMPPKIAHILPTIAAIITKITKSRNRIQSHSRLLCSCKMRTVRITTTGKPPIIAPIRAYRNMGNFCLVIAHDLVNSEFGSSLSLYVATSISMQFDLSSRTRKGNRL